MLYLMIAVLGITSVWGSLHANFHRLSLNTGGIEIVRGCLAGWSQWFK